MRLFSAHNKNKTLVSWSSAAWASPAGLWGEVCCIPSEPRTTVMSKKNIQYNKLYSEDARSYIRHQIIIFLYKIKWDKKNSLNVSNVTGFETILFAPLYITIKKDMLSKKKFCRVFIYRKMINFVETHEWSLLPLIDLERFEQFYNDLVKNHS